METMTVKDVLIATKELLGKISVPMSLIEQIGIPLAQGISNITQCIEAMDKAEKPEGEDA